MAQAVGVREFRKRLAEFLAGSQPVAITRHGETLGYYVPTPRPKNVEERLARMEKAASELEAAMAAKGVTEEDLIRDFERTRKRGRRARARKCA